MIIPKKENLKIWIDLTNSPHVLIFHPIVKELESRGHEVTMTAREYAQTVLLLNKYKMPYFLLGRHRGKSILRKGFGLVSRTAKFIRFAYGKKFDLALSHGSNDLAVASFFLRIPHVTMFDYEMQPVAHNINFRLSAKILAPELIPPDILHHYGAKDKKIIRYPGIKEEYYLSEFTPTPIEIEGISPDAEEIIITMRTPPDVSLYHRFKNVLFDEILEYVSRQKNVKVILLPRTGLQIQEFSQKKSPHVIIPQGILDGPNLIYHSDLVISAGGTMNREAAALGTPVYTVFEGEMGAIDKYLIETGKMKLVTKPEDIELKKKKEFIPPFTRNIKDLVNQILS